MKEYQQLTEEERIEIYALLQAGKKQCEIAKALNRNGSTICRELRRNRGQRGYRAKQAQRKASDRRKKPRTVKMTSKVVKYVEKRLKQEWSPEEISGRMEREIGTKVSHERIYQHVWMDKAQGGQLYQNLRIAGKKKRRKRRGIKDWRRKIPNRVDIDKRPKIVEMKERFGDWEADLVSGEHHRGFLVTLVERKSKFTLIGHVQRKTATASCKEIIRLMKPYKNLVHTITFDNGREFSSHQNVA